MTDQLDPTITRTVPLDRLSVELDQSPSTVREAALRPTVLHVVRNMGGGLAQAVYDYSESTPGYRHVLLADLEHCYQVADSGGHFAEAHVMPRGARSAMACIRRTVAQVQPDVIHAHSSFAGAFVRAGVPRRLRSRVIYTPHCYGFHRRDINPAVRAALYGIEWLLTQRCPNVAACSPEEQRVANRMRGSVTEYVPNVTQAPALVPAQGHRRDRPLVVAAGRLCAQKQPELFVEAAVRSQKLRQGVDWLWLGGGNEEYEAMFERAGVAFTGWLDRTEILKELHGASIYVHTAAWEGAPLTVLEAAAAGLPILGRDLPALRALGIASLWHDAAGLLAMIDQYPDAPAYAAARRINHAITVRHVPAQQSAALEIAYTRILAGAGQLVSA